MQEILQNLSQWLNSGIFPGVSLGLNFNVSGDRKGSYRVCYKEDQKNPQLNQYAYFHVEDSLIGQCVTEFLSKHQLNQYTYQNIDDIKKLFLDELKIAAELQENNDPKKLTRAKQKIKATTARMAIISLGMWNDEWKNFNFDANPIFCDFISSCSLKELKAYSDILKNKNLSFTDIRENPQNIALILNFYHQNKGAMSDQTKTLFNLLLNDFLTHIKTKNISNIVVAKLKLIAAGLWERETGIKNPAVDAVLKFSELDLENNPTFCEYIALNLDQQALSQKWLGEFLPGIYLQGLSSKKPKIIKHGESTYFASFDQSLGKGAFGWASKHYVCDKKGKLIFAPPWVIKKIDNVDVYGNYILSESGDKKFQEQIDSEAEFNVRAGRKEAGEKALKPQYVYKKRHIHHAILPIELVSGESVGNSADVPEDHPYFKNPHKKFKDRVEKLGGMGLTDRLKLCRELFHSLSALHKNGLYYGDIKDHNVLVDIKKNKIGEYVFDVKWVDQGLSTTMDYSNDESEIACHFGTPKYLPPEVVFLHKAQVTSHVYSCVPLVLNFLGVENPTEFRTTSGLGPFSYKDLLKDVKVPDYLKIMIECFIRRMEGKEFSLRHSFTADDFKRLNQKRPRDDEIMDFFNNMIAIAHIIEKKPDKIHLEKDDKGNEVDKAVEERLHYFLAKAYLQSVGHYSLYREVDFNLFPEECKKIAEGVQQDKGDTGSAIDNFHAAVKQKFQDNLKFIKHKFTQFSLNGKTVDVSQTFDQFTFEKNAALVQRMVNQIEAHDKKPQDAQNDLLFQHSLLLKLYEPDLSFGLENDAAGNREGYFRVFYEKDINNLKYNAGSSYFHFQNSLIGQLASEFLIKVNSQHFEYQDKEAIKKIFIADLKEAARLQEENDLKNLKIKKTRLAMMALGLWNDSWKNCYLNDEIYSVFCDFISSCSIEELKEYSEILNNKKLSFSHISENPYKPYKIALIFKVYTKNKKLLDDGARKEFKNSLGNFLNDFSKDPAPSEETLRLSSAKLLLISAGLWDESTGIKQITATNVRDDFKSTLLRDFNDKNIKLLKKLLPNTASIKPIDVSQKNYQSMHFNKAQSIEIHSELQKILQKEKTQTNNHNEMQENRRKAGKARFLLQKFPALKYSDLNLDSVPEFCQYVVKELDENKIQQPWLKDFLPAVFRESQDKTAKKVRFYANVDKKPVYYKVFDEFLGSGSYGRTQIIYLCDKSGNLKFTKPYVRKVIATTSKDFGYVGAIKRKISEEAKFNVRAALGSRKPLPHVYAKDHLHSQLMLDLASGEVLSSGDLADDNDLQNFSNKLDRLNLSFKERVKVARDYFHALYHIHHRGIHYADIKGQNVLWDEKTGSIGLIDFGGSTDLDFTDKSNTTRGNTALTAIYTPPEIKDLKVTPTSDIYSSLPFVLVLFGAVNPFKNKDKKEFQNLPESKRLIKIIKEKYSDEGLFIKSNNLFDKYEEYQVIKKIMAQFIRKIEQDDPKLRPSDVEIISFFNHLYACFEYIEHEDKDNLTKEEVQQKYKSPLAKAILQSQGEYDTYRNLDFDEYPDACDALIRSAKYEQDCLHSKIDIDGFSQAVKDNQDKNIRTIKAKLIELNLVNETIDGELKFNKFLYTDRDFCQCIFNLIEKNDEKPDPHFKSIFQLEFYEKVKMGLKDKNDYSRGRFFNSYTTGEKIAAKQFLCRLLSEPDEQARAFELTHPKNKKLIGALTQGTLGKIAKPLLKVLYQSRVYLKMTQAEQAAKMRKSHWQK